MGQKAPEIFGNKSVFEREQTLGKGREHNKKKQLCKEGDLIICCKWSNLCSKRKFWRKLDLLLERSGDPDQ
jgi:hypothetical protein